MDQHRNCKALEALCILNAFPHNKAATPRWISSAQFRTVTYTFLYERITRGVWLKCLNSRSWLLFPAHCDVKGPLSWRDPLRSRIISMQIRWASRLMECCNTLFFDLYVNLDESKRNKKQINTTSFLFQSGYSSSTPQWKLLSMLLRILYRFTREVFGRIGVHLWAC